MSLAETVRLHIDPALGFQLHVHRTFMERPNGLGLLLDSASQLCSGSDSVPLRDIFPFGVRSVRTLWSVVGFCIVAVCVCVFMRTVLDV